MGIFSNTGQILVEQAQLMKPGNDSFKAINEIIKSLNQNDYKNFTKKRARDIAIEYIDGKPVAFSYTRDYDIEEGLGVVFSTATNPKYRGKGYSKKLSNEVLKVSKRDHKVKEICWAADIDNYGSIAVAKSLGFEHWYDYGDTTVYKYPLNKR